MYVQHYCRYADTPHNARLRSCLGKHVFQPGSALPTQARYFVLRRLYIYFCGWYGGYNWSRSLFRSWSILEPAQVKVTSSRSFYHFLSVAAAPWAPVERNTFLDIQYSEQRRRFLWWPNYKLYCRRLAAATRHPPRLGLRCSDWCIVAITCYHPHVYLSLVSGQQTGRAVLPLGDCLVRKEKIAQVLSWASVTKAVILSINNKLTPHYAYLGSSGGRTKQTIPSVS